MGDYTSTSVIRGDTKLPRDEKFWGRGHKGTIYEVNSSYKVCINQIGKEESIIRRKEDPLNLDKPLVKRGFNTPEKHCQREMLLDNDKPYRGARQALDLRSPQILERRLLEQNKLCRQSSLKREHFRRPPGNPAHYSAGTKVQKSHPQFQESCHRRQLY